MFGLNDKTLNLILAADRFLYAMNEVQTVLNTQPFVYLYPGTGYGMTYFEDSFTNSTSRSIEKPLGASRDLENSAG